MHGAIWVRTLQLALTQAPTTSDAPNERAPGHRPAGHRFDGAFGELEQTPATSESPAANESPAAASRRTHQSKQLAQWNGNL